MPNAPLTFLFKDDGTVPNNPALPVLVYKGAAAIEGKRSPEGAIEKQFAANGWATASGAMASIPSCTTIP